MITFSDFSKRLALGQLKNTSAVDTNTDRGVIDTEYVATVLELTNQGLIDLTSRLPVITRQIDLVFVPDQNTYKLEAGASYLDDTETEVFVDDFVKVLDIYDSEGKRYTHDTDGHIITPTFNTLRFSFSIMEELGSKIRIRYQTKHPEITEADEINLPPNLVTGLQLFVASLYLSHMNSSEHTVKGDSYFAAYLRHIGEDETRNISSTSEVDLDTRLNDRGFV